MTEHTEYRVKGLAATYQVNAPGIAAKIVRAIIAGLEEEGKLPWRSVAMKGLSITIAPGE